MGLAVIFGGIEGGESLGGLCEVIGPTMTPEGTGFGAGAGM